MSSAFSKQSTNQKIKELCTVIFFIKQNKSFGLSKCLPSLFQQQQQQQRPFNGL